MKLTFNKYWIFIALCIIANVFIFRFMSVKLEKYMMNVSMDNLVYGEDLK